MRLLLLSFFILNLLVSHSALAAKVAIIMDDLGYRQTDLASLSLPTEITFSILPHTPLADKIAQQAKAQQREIILHMPMESMNGKNPGQGALMADMSSADLQTQLQSALESVPGAIGMNNHMGSKLTKMAEPMQTTMQFLAQHQLFFVDSRTTAETRAQSTAEDTGVQALRRHVFIDHYMTEKAMLVQFKRLIHLAKNNHNAIAIAHPHPQTLAFLQKHLPELIDNNIELVPLSNLLPAQLARHQEAEKQVSKGR